VSGRKHRGAAAKAAEGRASSKGDEPEAPQWRNSRVGRAFAEHGKEADWISRLLLRNFMAAVIQVRGRAAVASMSPPHAAGGCYTCGLRIKAGGVRPTRVHGGLGALHKREGGDPYCMGRVLGTSHLLLVWGSSASAVLVADLLGRPCV
jgi:hypothetical protein